MTELMLRIDMDHPGFKENPEEGLKMVFADIVKTWVTLGKRPYLEACCNNDLCPPESSIVGEWCIGPVDVITKTLGLSVADRPGILDCLKK